MHGHKFATSGSNVSDGKQLYVHGEHHYTLVTKIFYSYISGLTRYRKAQRIIAGEHDVIV